MALPKRIFLAAFLFCFTNPAFAQQIQLTNLYNQNVFLINPAASGLKPCFSAHLDHRNQWSGIGDNPTTNVLTLDLGLGEHGVGLDVRMTQTGLLEQFNTRLTYAYHLKVSESANLHAGISMGVINQNFRASAAIASDYTDPLLFTGNQSDLGLSTDFGLMFTTNRIRFGVAIPQIYSDGLFIEQETSQSKFVLKQHVLALFSADVWQNDQWTLTPGVLYRNVYFSGHQIDVGATIKWNNSLGIGAMYRTGYGLVGIIDLLLKEQFKVGYAYSFGGTIGRASHEIQIGLQLCRSKSVTPDPILPEKEILADTLSQVPQTITPGDTPDTVATEVAPDRPDTVQIATINIDSLNRVYGKADHHIRFGLNSPKSSVENADDLLAKTAAILKANPELNIRITGHACARGSEAFNRDLSEERAENAANWLEVKGVDRSRIQTQGKGETTPFNSRNDEENRRVQFEFYKKDNTE